MRDECNLGLEALSNRQPVQFPEDAGVIWSRFSRARNYTGQCVALVEASGCSWWMYRIVASCSTVAKLTVMHATVFATV